MPALAGAPLLAHGAVAAFIGTGANLSAFSGYLLFAVLGGSGLRWSAMAAAARGTSQSRHSRLWPVVLLILLAVFAIFHAWLHYRAIEATKPESAAEVLRWMIGSRYFLSARMAGVVLLTGGLALAAWHSLRPGSRYGGLLLGSIGLGALAFAAHHIALLAVSRDRVWMVPFILLPVVAQAAMLGAAVWKEPAMRAFLSPRDAPRLEGAMDRNNRITFWLFGALAPLAATAGSTIFISVSIWAVVGLLFRRYRLAAEPAAIAAGIAAATFFLVMATASLVNVPGGGDAASWMMISAYLGPLLLAPRFRLSPAGSLLPALAHGAAVGLLASLPVSLWELFLVRGGALRTTNFSGNAVVVAMILTLAIAAALTGLERLGRTQRIFRFSAIASGVVALALTASIAAIAAAFVILTLAGWRYRHIGWSRVRPMMARSPLRSAVTALVVLGAVSAVVTIPAVRLVQYGEATRSEEKDGASFAVRTTMWRAAASAFAARPLAGYGPARRSSAMAPYLAPGDSDLIEYSHVHNGLLTAGLAAGLPGMAAALLLLIAPVAIARRYARNAEAADVRFLAVSLSVLYGLCGLTGIQFFHDAVDALYLTALVLAGAAATGRECEFVRRQGAGNDA